jgi:hypothetical protein
VNKTTLKGLKLERAKTATKLAALDGAIEVLEPSSGAQSWRDDPVRMARWRANLRKGHRKSKARRQARSKAQPATQQTESQQN